MPFTPIIPAYTINLRRQESRRWSEVIKKDRAAATRIINNAIKEYSPYIENYPAAVAGAVSTIKNSYKLFGGRYVDEMEAWAKALDIDPGIFLAVQCSYEMAHAYELIQPLWESVTDRVKNGAEEISEVIENAKKGVSDLWRNTFGCTAGIIESAALGMVHVRNLDWPLTGMGRATRIFKFVDGKREFVTVGVAGMVGVLSGMVPGGWSATINHAPVISTPAIHRFGALFLLREVLETCDTYDEAVEALSGSDLSSSVFFTVCGVKPGQACVIERTPKSAGIRRIKDGVIAQANHFNTRGFKQYNKCMKEVDADGDVMYDWSVIRQQKITNALLKVKSATDFNRIARVLDIDPVLNEATCQQMVFCPAAGEYKAWREV